MPGHQCLVSHLNDITKYKTKQKHFVMRMFLFVYIEKFCSKYDLSIYNCNYIDRLVKYLETVMKHLSKKQAIAASGQLKLKFNSCE